jgi:hypothetical protein
MDGEVDLSVEQRPLELRGEEALAPDLRKRLTRLLRAVARRREHARGQLQARARGSEEVDDERGLSPCQLRGPRAECHRRGKRRGAH